MRGESSDGRGLRRLVGVRGFGDYQHWSFRCKTGVGEPAGNFGVIGAGHIDDNCCVRSDGNTVEAASVYGARVGGEEDAGSQAAVGKRDLRGSRGSEGRGDAGNDFEINVGGAHGVDFFGGAAEQERVAAFEANDDLVFARGVDEERVDFRLCEEAEAGAFADVDALGGGGDECENFRGDKRIVEDDASGLEEARSLLREEIGIAGAGADEEDFAS